MLFIYDTKFPPLSFLPPDEARGQKCGVLVHCLAGISRSVTVTVAYLMQKLNLSMNDAYDIVKMKKSNISPNFNFMGQLLDFERTLGLKSPCDNRMAPPSQQLYFTTPTNHNVFQLDPLESTWGLLSPLLFSLGVLWASYWKSCKMFSLFSVVCCATLLIQLGWGNSCWVWLLKGHSCLTEAQLLLTKWGETVQETGSESFKVCRYLLQSDFAVRLWSFFRIFSVCLRNPKMIDWTAVCYASKFKGWCAKETWLFKVDR